MNLIEHIDNNVFLKKIFSNGLCETVLIGKIGLSLDNRLLINLHTKQQPDIKVAKWGEWSKDYDVIIIELHGLSGSVVDIKNWKNTTYGKLNVVKKDNIIQLSHISNNCSIMIECNGLIFQKCTAYIYGESEY